MTPVEFYTARLDELEDLAKRAAFGWGAEWRTETAEEDWSVVRAAGKRVMFGCEDGDVTRHIAADDPAHILADIAAKRAVIDSYHAAAARCDAEPEWGDGLCDLTFYALKGVVTTLCLAFADHPDYDEAWRLTKEKA